jgi:tetratricopeptide (TPR) repeat protein
MEPRRHVRTELIELLLQQGLTARALSELLILGSNVPDDSATRVEIGRMYLRAGDARRAREFFDSVLEREPRNPQALSGSGEAAFVSGDYADARRLLAGVPDTDPAAALRVVADHLLTADPLAPRLSIEERRRRTARTLAHAGTVLEACGAASGNGAPDVQVQALADEHEAASAGFGARGTAASREAIEQVFDLVYRIERQVGQACPEAGPLGRAILLIGRRHGLDEP